MTKNYWKMLSLMLVALLSFGFVSCGDDDKDDGGSVSVSASQLYGLWEGYSVTISYQGQSYTQKLDDPTDAQRLEVLKDNTYKTHKYRNSEWIVDEVGTWELKGNKLTATDDKGKQHTITIYNVTSDTFTYEPDERELDDEAPEGTKYRCTYKRVR